MYEHASIDKTHTFICSNTSIQSRIYVYIYRMIPTFTHKKKNFNINWNFEMETHTSAAVNCSPLSFSTPSDCVDCGGSLRGFNSLVFRVVSSNFFTNSSGDANFLVLVFLRSFFAKKSSKSAIIGLLATCP